ncbi:hypothetical protein G3M48_001303, partial [Beauveria asiatica]
MDTATAVGDEPDEELKDERRRRRARDESTGPAVAHAVGERRRLGRRVPAAHQLQITMTCLGRRRGIDAVAVVV